MKRILLFLLVIPSIIFAQDHLAASRAQVDDALAPFYHGVASGDPLFDRVIIWTRVTTAAPTATVDWEVALDTTFAAIVKSGTVTTDSSKDYTVKVDVVDLLADTWYYYRFKTANIYSIIGRTRTAPVTGTTNLRFAVVACSNYQDGFFNAYRDIKKHNDVDAVIHLGDYIYEYGISDFTPGTDSSRIHEPDHEILTISDYRLRHSQYKLDPDLRAVHQQYPFITVWDDHETANDSWSGGAQNHTDSTEGNWFDRKEAGRTAYFEWMPIRDVYNSVDTIHRIIPFGNLVDFIMIDTRLEGREKQAGTSGPAVTDTNRTMLGAAQLGWFKQQLSASTAKWKLIGNQVMVSPLKVPIVGLVNQDQWDGYPAERAKILNHIQSNNIDNVVVLTGDIHTSWANDLPVDVANYNSGTGAGSVAVEYVCTSVTSGSFFTFTVPVSIIQTSSPNILYAELSKRGYLLLDVNEQRVQGDWIYMSTITSKNYTTTTGASWCDLDQANHLTNCGLPLQARTNRPVPAPEVNSLLIPTGIKSEPGLVTLSCYPNPFNNEIAIQYYINSPAKVELRITNVSGQTVYYAAAEQPQAGLYSSKVDISGLAAGTYIANLVSQGKVYSQKIVKVQ